MHITCNTPLQFHTPLAQHPLYGFLEAGCFQVHPKAGIGPDHFPGIGDVEVHRILSVEGGKDTSQLLLDGLGILPRSDVEMDFFGRLLEGFHFVGEDPGLFLVQFQDALDHDDPVLLDLEPAEGIGPGEGDHIQAAAEVFQGERSHPVPVLGRTDPQFRDDPSHGDPLSIPEILLAAFCQRRQPTEGGAESI